MYPQLKIADFETETIQTITQLEQKIKYVIDCLSVNQVEIDKCKRLTIPKDTENEYTDKSDKRLLYLIVKCQNLIQLYFKRLWPGVGVSLNIDLDVYEFWLFAETLEALVQAGVKLDLDKKKSLKNEHFRETSFELRVAYYYLQKGHKVKFITTENSPDILVDDAFTIECKTTNPVRLHKTLKLWQETYFSRVAKIIGAKYIKILLKQYMLEDEDWLELEKKLLRIKISLNTQVTNMILKLLRIQAITDQK